MAGGGTTDLVGDFCTLFPDRVFGIDLSYCCFRHDLAYGAGLDKITADLDLARCVAELGLGWVALLMLTGVTLFGWAFYPRKRR